MRSSEYCQQKHKTGGKNNKKTTYFSIMALYPNTNVTGHHQIQKNIYFVQSISKYL